MHVHILGICGTFMGSLALLAKQLQHKVTGVDNNVYPPMSTMLEEQGIEISSDFHSSLSIKPDQYIIGNSMKRGDPIIEELLNQQIDLISGPQWLGENVLRGRHVIAVAGTHGKTTTASMVAWILEHYGLNPGFLIGGVPLNFNLSARLGDSKYFVIEADEYDTAFFDKRSKFIHYRPTTCILNNLEFDHADIFDDLKAIKTQFHHLVRTIPGKGHIVLPKQDPALAEVIKMGCWSQLCYVGDDSSEFQAKLISQDGSSFEVLHKQKPTATINWNLLGQHNVSNALAAIAACYKVGVPVAASTAALAEFKSVKRRLELKSTANNICIYDDFAHHPTAINQTLQGMRNKIGTDQLWAVLDIRSNTMCKGSHKQLLPEALQFADKIIVYKSPKVNWDVEQVLSSVKSKLEVFEQTKDIVDSVAEKTTSGDHVVIMSNGGFDGLTAKLVAQIKAKQVA